MKNMFTKCYDTSFIPFLILPCLYFVVLDDSFADPNYEDSDEYVSASQETRSSVAELFQSGGETSDYASEEELSDQDMHTGVRHICDSVIANLDNLEQKEKEKEVAAGKRKGGTERGMVFTNRHLPEHQKKYCLIYKQIYRKEEPKGNDNKYDKVHACFLCGRLYSNIQIHLMGAHKKHPLVQEVRELMGKLVDVKDLDENSQEAVDLQKMIRQKQELLRYRGDHEHNTIVLGNRAGEMLINRPKVSKDTSDFVCTDFLPCVHCYQWIAKRSLSAHLKSCIGKKQGNAKDLKVAAEIFCRSYHLKNVKCSEALRDEVLPRMKDDAISLVAKDDPIIIQLGEIWFANSIGNKRKRKNFSTYRMRLAARLLLNLRDGEEDKRTMCDFLTPAHFDDIVLAAIKTCDIKEVSNENEMKHPSTAVKIGYDITRLVSAKMGIAIRSKDQTTIEECQSLLALYRQEWKFRVDKCARQLIMERRFKKEDPLPLPNDIKTFSLHLRSQLQEYSYTKDTPFRDVATTAMAYLICYNKRRPAEIEDIK